MSFRDLQGIFAEVSHEFAASAIEIPRHKHRNVVFSGSIRP